MKGIQPFKKEGLDMVSEHAQFPDKRGNSVEAGIMEMLSMMTSIKT